MTDPLASGLRLRLRRALRRTEAQHQQLRELVRELEEPLRAGAPVVAPEPLSRLRDSLQAHFELEDQLLFPGLHGLAPASAGSIETLSREHASFLEELRGMLDADAGCDCDAFLRWRAALGEHERREEQLLEGVLGE